MVNILIAEDSPTVSTLLKNMFESDPDIKVIGTVSNGKEAIKMAYKKKPDIITMDINMPVMDGLEATRRIMETNPLPIVVVSSLYNPGEVDISFQAMEAGAISILEKPSLKDFKDDYKRKNFINKIKAMSQVKVIKRLKKITKNESYTPPLKILKKDYIKAVVIGASTGGPPALQKILSEISKEVPVPVMIVQHIAKGFIDGMITWLKNMTKLPIKIAEYGEKALPGNIYFAPDDFHMELRKSGLISLSKQDKIHGVRPSVSFLFEKTAQNFGPDAIGILLTGMGRDGAEELKKMKDKGALTIAQDKKTSIVHGMPGTAIKLGGAKLILPLEKISPALNSLLKK